MPKSVRQSDKLNQICCESNCFRLVRDGRSRHLVDRFWTGEYHDTERSIFVCYMEMDVAIVVDRALEHIG